MTGFLERTVGGGFGFLAANLVARLGGLAFVWVASALMGPSGFGVLALALSVYGLATSLADGGLSTALVRFFAGKGEPDAERLIGAAASLSLGLSVLVALSAFLAAPVLASDVFSEPGLVGPIRIFALGLLLAVPLTHLRGLLQAREAVSDLLKLTVWEQLGKVGLVAIVLVVLGGATFAALAVVTSVVIPFALALRYAKELRIRVESWRPRWSAIKQVVRLSAPLLVVGLSYLLERHADRLMLGALADAASVGVYTLVSTIAGAGLVLHGALVSIFKPVVADAYRKERLADAAESYRFVAGRAGLASGALLLLFAGFGRELMAIAGSSYGTATAHAALMLLGALYFFTTWVGPTGSALQMSGGEWMELFNTLVFVVANVLLNFWLIPLFGLVGAAIATLTSGLVRILLQLAELRYVYGFLPWDHRHLLLLGAVGLATGLLLVTGQNHVLSFVLLLVCIAVMFQYLRTTLTEFERSAIARMWRTLSGT